MPTHVRNCLCSKYQATLDLTLSLQPPELHHGPLGSNSLCAAFMGVIGGWSPLSLPFAGVWSCRLDKMCCTVRPWVARSHELRFCCLFDETSHTYSPTGDWKSKVFLFDAAIMQTGWVKSAKMCINLAKKKSWLKSRSHSTNTKCTVDVTTDSMVPWRN